MPAWGVVIVFPTSGILIAEGVFIQEILWNGSNTWISKVTREYGYLVEVWFSWSDGGDVCKVTGKVEGQGCLFAGYGFFSFCERRVFAFHCTRLLLYTDGNFTVLFLYLKPFPFRVPLWLFLLWPCAYVLIQLGTVWLLQVVPIGCSKTLAINCQCMLHNPHQHRFELEMSIL